MDAEVSTGLAISSKLGMGSEIANIEASGIASYIKDGVAHSSFQRGEVLVRFTFKDGTILLGVIPQ